MRNELQIADHSPHLLQVKMTAMRSSGCLQQQQKNSISTASVHVSVHECENAEVNAHLQDQHMCRTCSPHLCWVWQRLPLHRLHNIRITSEGGISDAASFGEHAHATRHTYLLFVQRQAALCCCCGCCAQLQPARSVDRSGTGRQLEPATVTPCEKQAPHL